MVSFMNKKIVGILCASILCLSPIGIKASTTYATSEDGSKNYTSIDSAWDAAESGVKIVMQQDWNISSRLVLDSNKTATIEMNGHKISRNLTSTKSNGEVIKLCSNSTLNLSGKKAPDTWLYLEYLNSLKVKSYQSIKTGGMITGGYSSNGAGGIHMKSGSKLNLDTVVICGNNAEYSWGYTSNDGCGAGVYMDGESDSLVLNNAQISYNWAEYDGGGVYVNNKNSSITMTNSKISDNCANYKNSTYDYGTGGGVYIDAQNVTLTLNQNSQISNNYAKNNGGGIYTNAKNSKIYLNASSVDHNSAENNGGGIYYSYSNFELKSDNKDGSIYDNHAGTEKSGGGIYTDRCVFSSNEGKIDGIAFYSNYAYRGGAISVHQENVTVKNCNLSYDEAEYGGAIDVQNDNFVLENSTVQYNRTNSNSSAAIHVDSYNDITLKGIVNITENSNKDLKLETGSTTDAYILSTPDASSRVGIYVDKNRKLGKNQTSDAPNIYFADNSNEYEISYDESSKQISSTTPPNNEVSENTDSQEETTNTEQSEESTAEEVQMYTVTINMINEAGTWQNTQQMTINENEPFEFQAPTVEDKLFVEIKDLSDTLTVDNDVVKTDSITSDVEITIVYKDSDSESEESTATASIFGDGNVVIASVIIAVLVVLGAFVFIKKKKQ